MHHQPMRVHLRLTASGKDEGDPDRVRGMLRLEQAQEPPPFLVNFLVRPSFTKCPKIKRSSGSGKNNEPRLVPCLISVSWNAPSDDAQRRHQAEMRLAGILMALRVRYC